MVRMLKTTTKFLAGMAAVATAMGAFSLPALADDSGKYLTVTLIGDSYTAGNGAGAYYGPKDSYRSTRNWGHTYVNWLNSQGVHTTVHNLAASGAVTANVLDKQIPALDPTTDVVMLTIGGNDIKFEDIVTGCFAGYLSSINKCAKAMTFAKETFPKTRENIVEVLRQVQAKVAQDAQIILVGYPLLSMDKDWHVQPGWFSPGKPYPAAREVREFGQFATKEQEKLVAEWNANPANTVKITFIPTEMHFAGHEPDPDNGQRNPLRWLNEFIEDEGQMGPNGEIISKDTGWFDYASWYHPNITGHSEIAKLLQNQIGIPKNVRSVRNPKRDSDVVFVVETSTGTADKLDQIKKQIRRVVDEASREATSAGKEARFSLVTYRDLPASKPEAAPEAAAAPRGISGFRSVGAAEKSQSTTPQSAASTISEGDTQAPHAKNTPVESAPTDAGTTANNPADNPSPEASANAPASGATEASADAEAIEGAKAVADTRDADEPAAPDTPGAPNGPEAAVEADSPAENVQTAPETALEEVMVVSEFTADRDTFLALVDKLTVNGESGGPAVYNALKKAIAMPFTAGARKRVMVLGDGELADTPANNALDWSALVSAAFTANTAEVLVLDPDADTNPALTSLSLSTGGHVTALETVRPLIVDPPTARISSMDVLAVGEEAIFDASGSFATEGSIMKYEWDFNGDGTYDTISEVAPGEAANPLQGHRYGAPFTGNAAVRVTDKFGHTAVDAIKVTVTKDGDLVDDEQDNCPADRNPEQIDTDKDGIGDACDPMPHGMPILPPPSTPDNSTPEPPAAGGEKEDTPAPQDEPKAKKPGVNGPQAHTPKADTPRTTSPAGTQEANQSKKPTRQSMLATTGLNLDVLAGAGALVFAGGLLIARSRRH